MREIRLSLAFLMGALLFGQTLAGHQTIINNQQGSIGKDAQNDRTPRGLYISKAADAIRVKVLDATTGATVSPSQEFTRDDKLKVVIESNFESYRYIINVEIIKNTEKRFLLYPNARALDSRIRPNELLELPIAFDEKPATEVLQVIVSRNKIAYLNAALKGRCSESENPCRLERSVAARVASIVGDKRSSQQSEEAGIFPRQSRRKQNQTEFRSRDIILSPGKDNDAKESYVAIPIKAGGNGHLKPKEVFVFELRLKHV